MFAANRGAFRQYYTLYRLKQLCSGQMLCPEIKAYLQKHRFASRVCQSVGVGKSWKREYSLTLNDVDALRHYAEHHSNPIPCDNPENHKGWVSLQDVARNAGVCVATVRSALRKMGESTSIVKFRKSATSRALLHISPELTTKIYDYVNTRKPKSAAAR